MSEHRKILKLHENLLKADFHKFPPKGTGINVSANQGVYVIYSPENEVLHVGRTVRGEQGLNQRLRNHLRNQSSFSKIYLKKNGNILRMGYKFKFIEVSDSRERALLEALTAGMLCPEYIGLGELKGLKTF